MTTAAETRPFESDDGLAEAIASFEQARDAGSNPDPEDWLRCYPEVAAKLADFFAARQYLGRLAGALSLPAAPETRSGMLGDYEIRCELGRGGMGVVYKARHVKFQRLVALKMILAGEHAGAVRMHLARAARAPTRLAEIGALRDAMRWAGDDPELQRQAAKAHAPPCVSPGVARIMSRTAW